MLWKYNLLSLLLMKTFWFLGLKIIISFILIDSTLLQNSWLNLRTASYNIAIWRNWCHFFLIILFLGVCLHCKTHASLKKLGGKVISVSPPPLMHPHADFTQLMFTRIELSSDSHIFNQSSIWISRRSQMAWPLPGS